MKKQLPHRISKALIVAAALICLQSPLLVAEELEAPASMAKEPPDSALAKLESRVADIWGPQNLWSPRPYVWVQYEPDLGERSAVDFLHGVAHVQILLKATDDPYREIVRAHLRQGVGNLIMSEATDPTEMANGWKSGAPPAAQKREIRVYIVRRGDSLWNIARRFRMRTEELATLNGLAKNAVLPTGRSMKVMVYASHDLALESSPRPPAEEPLLIDQIRMADGRPVPRWLIREFAAEVLETQPLGTEKVVGADGIERLAVGVKFELVSDHMEVRARKFHPLVLKYAEKHLLDPALIMAIIHTESVFNPRARSSTPAYGLMQLVPYGGGREAYRMIYGHKRKLTPRYLYDPANNIELGAAYVNILENRYMGAILDPISRTYCAVAAYNAGAANVGRAFVPKKSITRATPLINSLKPSEVYARLLKNLPYRESRNYVRKVVSRIQIYRQWQ